MNWHACTAAGDGAGAGIGASEAALVDNLRARIVKVTRGDSPNYLFIDLTSPPPPTPANSHSASRALTATSRCVTRCWRTPGFAERRDFDTRDVILNLMPDRYANGDPCNDRVAGYAEAADRSNPGSRHGDDLHGMTDHLDYIAGMGYGNAAKVPDHLILR